MFSRKEYIGLIIVATLSNIAIGSTFGSAFLGSVIGITIGDCILNKCKKVNTWKEKTQS